MARKPLGKSDDGPIVIVPPERESIEVFAVGTMPKIFNAVSEKARRELLLPSGAKNRAAREAALKHDPMQEYRASTYQFAGDDAPTRLYIPAIAFKKALLSAAVRTPGVMRTEIGQLLYVRSTLEAQPDFIPVYGVPELSIMVVRNSDIARTPDMRTRAIMRHWCCRFRLVFTKPLLNASTCVNLLATAGMICGVGDYRQEKGTGSYGQFELVSPDDASWQAIAAGGGRDAQDDALRDPDFYDADSASEFAWFTEELRRRGRSGLLKANRDDDAAPADAATRRRNGGGEAHVEG